MCKVGPICLVSQPLQFSIFLVSRIGISIQESEIARVASTSGRSLNLPRMHRRRQSIIAPLTMVMKRHRNLAQIAVE